jgi:hypothetical protein
MNVDTATIVYSYFFVGAATFAGVGYIAKHYVLKHTEELSDKLDRISYALFNEGRGMEWQLKETNANVKELIVNQQAIKIDVEVLKATQVH